MKFDKSPTILKDKHATNYSRKLKWNLRNLDKLVQNSARSKFGEDIFLFLPKL